MHTRLFLCSEPTDDESLRTTEEGHSQILPDNEAGDMDVEAEEAAATEELSSSASCSSAFVKLQIVNGVLEEDDGETIDEDQPDEDAAMIVVTHVSLSRPNCRHDLITIPFACPHSGIQAFIHLKRAVSSLLRTL